MKIHTIALTFALLAHSASASVPRPRSTTPRSDKDVLPTNGTKRFSLGQIRNDRFQSHDVPASLILAHAKYGDALPPHLKHAIEINPDLNRKFSTLLQQGRPSCFHLGGSSTGSVPAFPAPMADSEYVIPVKIGTPPQEVCLDLDTGSADFWTVSTDTYPLQINGQMIYDPGASNTSERVYSQGWIVQYGDGAGAAGVVYRDRVQIGETSFDHQAIQSAVQISPSISSDSFSSGILGMANSAANTVRPDKQLTYMDNIKDQLEQPLFTANLQRGRPGNYNFGYINESEYIGPIEWAQINLRSPLWEISVSGYQVGKDGNYHADGWNAIVDTGTTLLLAPQAVVDDYYSRVDGAGFNQSAGAMVFPCNATLPDFVFGLGSYRGVIPGHYINYAPVDDTHCYGGIQASHGTPFGVLGDVLLKAQFVVFDWGSAIVGFANKETDPPS